MTRELSDFFVEGFKMLDHKMHTDMEVEIKLY